MLSEAEDMTNTEPVIEMNSNHVKTKNTVASRNSPTNNKITYSQQKSHANCYALLLKHHREYLCSIHELAMRRATVAVTIVTVHTRKADSHQNTHIDLSMLKCRTKKNIVTHV